MHFFNFIAKGHAVKKNIMSFVKPWRVTTIGSLIIQMTK